MRTWAATAISTPGQLYGFNWVWASRRVNQSVSSDTGSLLVSRAVMASRLSSIRGSEISGVDTHHVRV